MVSWANLSQVQGQDALQLWERSSIVSVNPPVRGTELAVMDMNDSGQINQYMRPHGTEQQGSMNATQGQVNTPVAQVVNHLEAQIR